MIVDDEPDIRELVKKHLEAVGHSIIPAENGMKCLELLKDKNPDIIFMDIRMPELSGWEIIKEIRNKGLCKDIPIVMLTVEELTLAKVVKEDLEELTGYIEKPFSKTELIDTVEHVTEEMNRICEKASEIGTKGNNNKLIDKYIEINRKILLHKRLIGRLKEMIDEDRLQKEITDIRDILKSEKLSLKMLKLRKKIIKRMTGIEE